MKRGLKRIWVALPAGAFLLMATVARAEQASTSAAEQKSDMAFRWIHFFIVAGVLYWLFKKVLPPVFRRKADVISDAISKATAAKVEAERRLKEAAVKMTRLEQEVADFRATAQRESLAELERLRAATKSDAEKIVAAAKAEIEAAVRSARVELKALAAKLAVDGAESLVAKQMTPALQDTLINSFVQTLQGRPN
jgi:F-type H+-transporting ATPase subunit b